MTAVAIELRRLSLSHLGDIEGIEKSAYPTPWSRTMFASELAKPTSICLGAFEGDQLVGYIINSRYVDAWHVMNVAVDPDHRRRGIATRLLEAPVRADEERRPPRLHARGARLERWARSTSTSASASSAAACARATTRTTARTRS